MVGTRGKFFRFNRNGLITRAAYGLAVHVVHSTSVTGVALTGASHSFVPRRVARDSCTKHVGPMCGPMAPSTDYSEKFSVKKG